MGYPSLSAMARRSVLWLSVAAAVLIGAAVQRSEAQVALVNVVPGASKVGCLNATQGQLAAGVNCSSVGYALQLLTRYISETTSATITVYYDHAFTQDREASIELSVPTSADAQLLITGFNNIVDCSSSPNSGVFLSGFRNATIAYLTWLGCGIRHDTTAYYTQLSPDLFPIKASSALVFFQCSAVYILHCTFTNSTRGSGVSIYDASDILLDHSDFVGNIVVEDLKCGNFSEAATCSPQATGLYIETTQCGGLTDWNCSSADMAVHTGRYVISDCHFTGNENPQAYNRETKYIVPTSINDHWPFGKGGGLHLSLRGNVQKLQVAIEGSLFSGNKAHMGGGMTATLHPMFSGLNVSLTGCKFKSNLATDSGGGLLLGVWYDHAFESADIIPSSITLTNCPFFNNTARRWGGGTSIYSGANAHNISSLEMARCDWLRNQAHHSAPALGITSSNTQLGISPNITILPKCHDCTFLNNYVTLVTGHSRVYGYGAVFIQGVPLTFTGLTLFVENTESALCISSTSVELYDSVTFEGNKGFTGGAMLLLGTSWINLNPNLTLIFENNTAFKDGGAIHYTYPPSLSLRDFKDCFIQYRDKAARFHEWKVVVKFSGNTAFQNGDAVYVSSSQECTWGGAQVLYNPFNANNPNSCYPFDYKRQASVIRAVSTPAIHIDYNALLMENYSSNSWYEYSVMPGATFKIPVKITDYFHNETSSVVTTGCHNVSNYLQYNFQRDLCKPGGDYLIEGLPNTFGLRGELAFLKIRGRPKSTILFVMQSDDMQPVVVPLLVNLRDCDYGFVLEPNSHPETCVCFSKATRSKLEDFLCVDQSDNAVVPCIRNGYWYGHVKDAQRIQTCISGKCTTKCDKCGSLPENEWCKLPSQEDKLCTGHRSGPLCSECEGGLTLTYDSHSCKDCSAGKAVGLWVLFVIYWIFIILQLVAIIKLDIRIGSGYLYIFLYYFSVLKYILWYNLPGNYLTALLNIFGTLTRLDPEIYVYSELCVFSGATSVQYEMFHYLHPAVVLSLVAILITISHFTPRLAVFSGNYAIQAICYILLLAYTSLAETSLNLLNPTSYLTSYPHHDNEPTFVQIQPGTLYMDSRHHLPYALFALAVEVLVVLPFSIFMLFAPLLMRCMNLVKVKPILDEYQSCYKDKYRWFAGVYLLGRQLFILTSIVSLQFGVNRLLNQIICTAILLLHATIHPYRQRLLNYVDTFFLANLTLLSFLYTSSGVSALPWNSAARNGVVTVLILLPSIYFLLMVSVGFARCVGTKRRSATFTSPLLSVGPSRTPSVVDDEFPSRLLEEENKQRSLSRSASQSGSETQPLLTDGKVQSWYQRLGARLSVNSRSRAERDTPSTNSSATNSGH